MTTTSYIYTYPDGTPVIKSWKKSYLYAKKGDIVVISEKKYEVLSTENHLDSDTFKVFIGDICN